MFLRLPETWCATRTATTNDSPHAPARLRTQVWVDNLNPEFLEPAMSEVISDLMHGLWALLKYNNPLATKVRQRTGTPVCVCHRVAFSGANCAG